MVLNFRLYSVFELVSLFPYFFVFNLKRPALGGSDSRNLDYGKDVLSFETVSAAGSGAERLSLALWILSGIL